MIMPTSLSGHVVGEPHDNHNAQVDDASSISTSSTKEVPSPPSTPMLVMMPQVIMDNAGYDGVDVGSTPEKLVREGCGYWLE